MRSLRCLGTSLVMGLDSQNPSEAGVWRFNVNKNNMGGQHRKPGSWPRRGPNYAYDVAKALVVQVCLEVVRRWIDRR
jgi:hypothetical protein